MANAASTTCDPGAEAFCVACPGPEKLTSLLQGFGFHLTFQMEAIMYPAYTRLPPLPAQYHYRDEYGTEVISLSGRDTDPDGLPLPAHASRLWVYCGRDKRAYRRIAQVLAHQWASTWRRLSQAYRDVA